MDGKNFPEPEKYLPERHQDNGQADNFAFCPFGRGPRKCLGKTFSVPVTLVF